MFLKNAIVTVYRQIETYIVRIFHSDNRRDTDLLRLLGL